MIRRSILLFVVFILLSAAGGARAHEVRPGFLELRQTGPEAFDVLWKVPARGNARLGIYARLPGNCEEVSPVRRARARGAFTERWTVSCKGGLAGGTVAIDGLSATLTDVLVRLERSDGTNGIARLTPSAPSFVVAAAPSRLRVAETYLRLGVEHILLGIDHLLFVACLLLLAGTGRRILITITGFTLAHSLTLALSALEWVRLPVPPVEAAIALSIVFLAVEIARGEKSSLTHRYPIAVSASFGLLHGFGFAAALREIGLPQTELPTALLFFNVGVEIGQVLFVLALIVALLSFRKAVSRSTGRTGTPKLLTAQLQTPACYIIGAVASYWLIDRVSGFWL